MDGLQLDTYHMPHICDKCGGVMVYIGVGEYHCERCDWVAYDDYGKVRLYLEHHPGATVVETEAGTGVSRRTIRQMLREDRLEVAEGSRTLLACLGCGIPIRSGSFCPQCEIRHHRRMEELQRMKLTKGIQGFGTNDIEEQQGAKRYTREK